MSPDVALQATGINPATATADERERLEAAEREVIEEALAIVREAAKTNPKAAQWLRSRGLGE